MPALAGTFSIFPHCRSSACSSRNLLYISPLPQQCLLPQECYLYFLTAAAVLAPAGGFPPGPSPPSYPTPPPLPSTTHNGPFPLPFPTAPRHHRNPPPPSCFLHCRSSACSSRNLLYISPLPQQCLLQQEPSLYFPTAPAVTAPAGALSVFPTTAVVSAPAGALSIFPTAAAVPAPAGAFSMFSHCPSSVCSRRSATCISSLPQQCPLPQEPSQYFPTAAAVPAPAGAPSISPHCRSSVCSRRSAIYIFPLPRQCPLPQEPFRTSPLPQQCLLPQELHQYLPTAAAVSTLTSSFLSPRCHSSTLQQKPLLPPRCRSIITSGVQHPISPKPRARNCDHFGRICSRNVICATPKYIWEHLCECK